jgi:hypothetical protein
VEQAEWFRDTPLSLPFCLELTVVAFFFWGRRLIHGAPNCVGKIEAVKRIAYTDDRRIKASNKALSRRAGRPTAPAGCRIGVHGRRRLAELVGELAIRRQFRGFGLFRRQMTSIGCGQF